ncbi:MAG: uroporphyrinogen decarboxylase family protein [Anaerolineae bacterium]
MNKRERVYAALQGRPVDRLPVSIWRHFHKKDQVPEQLAQATLEFYRRYDLDLIKVTPSGLYAIEDWGASIRNADDDNTPPRLKRPVIEDPQDWRELEALSVEQGALGRELQAIAAIRDELGQRDAPVLMTLFSPLTLAFKLAGEAVQQHLRDHPGDLHFGLATIAETTARFGAAALAAGADGIFFATQLARSSIFTVEEYHDFGERYDLIVLEYLTPQTDLIVLHLHGNDVFFDLVNYYPVAAVSWHDREGTPSLRDAMARTRKTLMAGLDRDLLATGSPEEVAEQVRDALRQTGGVGLILAPACVIPPETPEANLQAIVETAHAMDI